MLLKGRPAEAFARRPDPAIWAVLCFGEDDGLGADAARALAAAWSAAGPAEVSSLDEDAVRKEPALLFDTLEAVSLLGDTRIIRLRISGEKTAALLTEAIKTGERMPGRFAAKLIIEAGNLPAKSALRAAAESAQHTACLQLFSDTAGDIESRTKAALLAAGATIAPEALAHFLGDLPGHRAMANQEIEKLGLYAQGLGRPVSLGDIHALSATDIDHDLAGAVIAALDGRVVAAHRALERVSEAGTSPISILRSLQFEIQRMLAAQEKIAAGDPAPGKALRPPVWPSEWPAYRARLGKWPVKRLVRVMERIYEAEQQAKTAGGAAEAVVRILINDLARTAETAS